MKFYTTSTNNDMSIRIGDRDGSYGFNWIYRGTATGNDNSLELWGDDSTSGELAVKAIEVKQNGAVHIDNLVSSLSWGQVTGKPSAFTPSTHTHSNITITAGNGLSGGGTLAANRTITLGTPSTLTNATTNSVAASSHTHAITTTTVGAANTIVATDASGGVRGNAIKIGSNWSLELSGTELQIKYGGVLKQRMLSDGSFVAEGEVSALGEGAGGSTGGSYERLDAWTDYAAGKEGWVLSALLGKNLDTRVTNLNNSIPNIQVVSSLPTSPTAGVFYFVKE